VVFTYFCWLTFWTGPINLQFLVQYKAKQKSIPVITGYQDSLWNCMMSRPFNTNDFKVIWLREHECRIRKDLKGDDLNLRGCIQKFPDWVITKYTLTTINTHWKAIQRVMAAKLTKLTHKLAIQLHLVAESCTICSSCSRRSVRKLLVTPSYLKVLCRVITGIEIL
jgi:hypothetical protein